MGQGFDFETIFLQNVTFCSQFSKNFGGSSTVPNQLTLQTSFSSFIQTAADLEKYYIKCILNGTHQLKLKNFCTVLGTRVGVLSSVRARVGGFASCG